MDVHPDASLLLVAVAPMRIQGRESNVSGRGELCDRAFHVWWLRKALLGAVPLPHAPFADDALHRAGKRWRYV